MIAVDTNILVYAHRNDAEWNEKARSALEPFLHSDVRWSIPWPCVHEFISIVSNKRIYAPPTPLEVIFGQLETWASAPGFRFLGEGNNHLDALKAVALSGRIAGGQIHDARIAAICLQHGVSELWTADRDFSRYPKLKTRNPLVT